MAGLQYRPNSWEGKIHLPGNREAVCQCSTAVQLKCDKQLAYRHYQCVATRDGSTDNFLLNLKAMLSINTLFGKS